MECSLRGEVMSAASVWLIGKRNFTQAYPLLSVRPTERGENGEGGGGGRLSPKYSTTNPSVRDEKRTEENRTDRRIETENGEIVAMLCYALLCCAMYETYLKPPLIASEKFILATEQRDSVQSPGSYESSKTVHCRLCLFLVFRFCLILDKIVFVG